MVLRLAKQLHSHRSSGVHSVGCSGFLHIQQISEHGCATPAPRCQRRLGRLGVMQLFWARYLYSGPGAVNGGPASGAVQG